MIDKLILKKNYLNSMSLEKFDELQEDLKKEKEVQEVYKKYNNNESLTKDDILELLRDNLFESIEIQSNTNPDDPINIEAYHKEKVIRFIMDLIEKMKG